MIKQLHEVLMRGNVGRVGRGGRREGARNADGITESLYGKGKSGDGSRFVLVWLGRRAGDCDGSQRQTRKERK